MCGVRAPNLDDLVGMDSVPSRTLVRILLVQRIACASATFQRFARANLHAARSSTLFVCKSRSGGYLFA